MGRCDRCRPLEEEHFLWLAPEEDIRESRITMILCTFAGLKMERACVKGITAASSCRERVLAEKQPYTCKELDSATSLSAPRRPPGKSSASAHISGRSTQSSRDGLES